MANNVIGLFENESIAESVVEELVASGFNSSVIKRFRGNNDQLEDELRREGIPADEASYYVNGLNEGGALVSVRAEENETDSAVDIMNRYVSTNRNDLNAASAGTESTGTRDTGFIGADPTVETSARGDTTAEVTSKGIDAGSADYDGVAGGTGSEPARSTGAAFPVGREAYASYKRPERATTAGTQETATANTTGNSSIGFPVGREAYASYKRPERAAPSGSGSTESPDSWTDSGTQSSQSSGLTVGREAYEAYSREKASKQNS